MSRVGIEPITVPDKVKIDVAADNTVTVEGPKGKLQQSIYRGLKVEMEDGTLTVVRPTEQRVMRAQHGLARTLIANMIKGVTEGHEKGLEIHGVGYRAQMQGKDLLLNMGYSHPVVIQAPQGIEFEVKAEERGKAAQLFVRGIDKALVGQIAADIRKVRRPDPYKGKGIRYIGEYVKIKPGKRASA